MPMTPAELQKALVWVKAHDLAPCRTCGGGKHELHNSLVCLPNWSNRGTDVNETMPCLAMTCTACGTTLLVNARPAGLVTASSA
jgi:hypothetical protein